MENSFESSRRIDDNEGDNEAGCLKAKRTPIKRKAECKEHCRLLTSLVFYNPLCMKPKKSQCKLFSLEECSDIEPISEDDDPDEPICEVQPFNTVPRVFGATTYTRYPCIENMEGKDWELPPHAKKYVKEVVLREWTDYNLENPDVLAHVNKEQKLNMKKELLSEAMEFVTTSIHDRVMSHKVVDKQSVKRRGCK